MTCFHDHILDALDVEYESSTAPMSAVLGFCLLMFWSRVTHV